MRRPSRAQTGCEGTLWLVDPFHLSRISWLNATRRAARSAPRDRSLQERRNRVGRLVVVKRVPGESGS